MKKWIHLLLIWLLLVSLWGCTGGTDSGEKKGNFSPDFPEHLHRYASPWELDVLEQARQDGKIHYYFMASKSMSIDLTDPRPYLWGDSCLIVFPNGQTMLVDSGAEAYGPVLLENLKRMKVEKLDYFLITHPDEKHFSGAFVEAGLLDTMPVGTVLYSGIIREGISDRIHTRCQEKNIPVQVLKQGDTMAFGQVRMEVLWPSPGADGQKLEETAAVKNASVVVRFDYKAHSSLFAGDLYADGEEQLVAACGDKLDADLLKVPNHGEDESSSLEFIRAVSPEVAMATGYLTNEIIAPRYESQNAKFLFDMYDGYVHVESDGTDMIYDTVWSRVKEES